MGAHMQDLDYIQALLDDNITIAEVARIVGMPRQTLYTYMNKYGIERQPFTHITDDHLVAVVLEIKQNHPNDGYVLMDGHLKARNPPIKVQRWRLRAAVRYVDAEGVEARKSRTIKSRQYWLQTTINFSIWSHIAQTRP